MFGKKWKKIYLIVIDDSSEKMGHETTLAGHNNTGLRERVTEGAKLVGGGGGGRGVMTVPGAACGPNWDSSTPGRGG